MIKKEKFPSSFSSILPTTKIGVKFIREVNQMINGIYPALSALRALGQKLGVTANNVANVNSDGFKKSRALLEEASPSGVMVSISRIETPGAPLPAGDGTTQTRESSNVEIGEEMVNLLTTKNAYGANLKTLRAEEEVLGTLFDIIEK
jgi:flagellar basal-body rod protein FlgC